MKSVAQHSFTCIMVLLIGVVVYRADAVLQLYEPFTNGPIGESAAFTAGGSGLWTDGWLFDFGPNAHTDRFMFTSGLSFLNLQSSGYAVHNWSFDPARPFDASGMGTPGSTNWFSLLFFTTNCVDDHRLRIFTSYTGLSGQGIGFNLGAANGGSLYGKIGNQTSAGAVVGLNNAVHLVLGQAVWAEETNVTLNIWVDPSERFQEALLGVPPVTISGTATAFFSTNCSLFIRAEIEKDIVYDEIRMGTTMIDVLPLPEPLGLIGLGLVAALWRRR